MEYYGSNIKPGIASKFEFRYVSEYEIFHILKNIKSKAFGSDNINLTMIIKCCPHLVAYITHIINECIKNSYFPKTWKQAHVLPLPKINEPQEMKDLRSISILPILSKIMEKSLDKQIRGHINAFQILPSKQSGFREGYSCALTSLTDIYSAL